MISRLLWGAVALLAVILAVVLVPAGPGGPVPDQALAHIITPMGTPGDALVHLEIDADATNGDGPCNPVDATAEVGGMHKVAVCLTSSSVSPTAFNVEVHYDSNLNLCTVRNLGGMAFDDNPDANLGTTSWTTPNLGTGCDCASGTEAPPTCDSPPGEGVTPAPGEKTAYISCVCSTATLPVGAGVSSPLAVVTFNALGVTGTDNLAFGVGAVYGAAGLILRCPGASCIGATDEKTGGATRVPTSTPTASPTATSTPWCGGLRQTPCPTSTPTPKAWTKTPTPTLTGTPVPTEPGGGPPPPPPPPPPTGGQLPEVVPPATGTGSGGVDWTTSLMWTLAGAGAFSVFLGGLCLRRARNR